MTKLLIDGVQIGKDIREALKTKVNSLTQKPGLAVILVGNNPASLAYIGMKQKACQALGYYSEEIRIDPSEGQAKLEAVIDSLNARADIHGILLQLPLPKGFDEKALLARIAVAKDVDGFHPENVGKVLADTGGMKPCTPYGVMKMLEAAKIECEGKHVVVLGRSNIVGKPMAALMLQRSANATVTVCHSKTQNLKAITQQADILIAALGIPEFVKADMVKENAVVIDVGINRVEDSEDKRGYRLVGDVDFEAVAAKTSAITPVPGGVGPLTIAMLMQNTYEAFCLQEGIA